MKQDIYATQAFIDTLVGIPKFSYPAHQNAPRPNTEFASVKLLEEYQEGLPVHTQITETDEYTDWHTRSLSRLLLRIGIVETDGIASTKIVNGWTQEPMKELMIASGYGFIKINPISLEDAKLEKEWEYRQGFSLELYVERLYQYRVDNITGMTITGEFATSSVDSIITQIVINQ